MVDFTTKLGVNAAKRLQTEHVVWLTTTSSDGTPQPNPVWFYWDGESILIYSQPASAKIGNIRRNPKVSLNFNDEEGGNITVLTGVASLDEHPKHNSRYLEKYCEHIPKIGYTAESLAATYSIQIRIVPSKLRGF
jgi:PPOX class probable F420-dependent enzyme